ncbi:uromodulin-like [Hypanus sabinus]|uniref:uromodulin-like n=1 Tax=Hypanus sabinus TaxID=79690 RepID=UPI0028C45EE6|nr:uromodulin-like [Hypanus sabinus]
MVSPSLQFQDTENRCLSGIHTLSHVASLTCPRKGSRRQVPSYPGSFRVDLVEVIVEALWSAHPPMAMGSWVSAVWVATEEADALWHVPRVLEPGSGGWKIPETVVPQYRCSGKKPGWLNGPHPNVGEGEVTRTVCFSKDEKPCEKNQEIRVKNCSGYFVYRLWPTPGNDAVYCTDPRSDTTCEPQGAATGEPSLSLTITPEGSVSSDFQSSTTPEPPGSETSEPSLGLTNPPAGSASSGTDSQSDTTPESSGSETSELSLDLTTSPAGSVSSGLETSTLEQSTGLSTGEHTQELSSVPAGDTSSVTDSTLGDPCVTHTVLDQPWRSTDCSNTECTGGQWMGDGNLTVGWYRFNSSGGWKIPETVVPQDHCSGEKPGWLNGPHPNVGEGEVTRTVCFTVGENTCPWRREIRVKNCSGYFVYRLWPTPWSTAVYCTGRSPFPRDTAVW